MRVLTLAAGRTWPELPMLIGHLAVAAGRALPGATVLLDMAGGTTRPSWVADADGGPRYEAIAEGELDEALAKLAQDGTKLAILYAPAGAQAHKAVAAADLLAIPTLPEAEHLHSLGGLIDVAEDHGTKFIFAISNVDPDEGVSAEVALALCQYGTVAPPMISDMGALVSGAAPSAEVAELWDYLSGHLGLEAAGPPTAERRRFPRWSLERGVRLDVGGKKLACQLKSVSAGGALIDVSVPIAEGSDVVLEDSELGTLNAKVVYTRGRYVGVSFADDAGCRWELVKKLSAEIDAGRRGARRAVG